MYKYAYIYIYIYIYIQTLLVRANVCPPLNVFPPCSKRFWNMLVLLLS